MTPEQDEQATDQEMFIDMVARAGIKFYTKGDSAGDQCVVCPPPEMGYCAVLTFRDGKLIKTEGAP